MPPPAMSACRTAHGASGRPRLLANRAIRYDGRMAISHPTDPRIRGLAAAVLTSDIPPWEFDIKAVEPGSDVVEISD